MSMINIVDKIAYLPGNDLVVRAFNKVYENEVDMLRKVVSDNNDIEGDLIITLEGNVSMTGNSKIQCNIQSSNQTLKNLMRELLKESLYLKVIV